MVFRRKETEARRRAKSSVGKDASVSGICFMCDVDGRTFHYWKLIDNIYPYDRIAKRHMMIVPIRHFGAESEMTEKERQELTKIKEAFAKESWDAIIENFPRKRTVISHYHLHLLELLPIFDDE